MSRKPTRKHATLHRRDRLVSSSSVWHAVRSARRKRSHVDVWGALTAELDPGLLRPKLAPHVEVAHFRTRWGSGYTMVKEPRAPTYLRLSEEQGRLLQFFDGRRTVRDIVVEDLEESGTFDGDAVTELIQVLYEAEMMQRPWIDAYEAVRSKRPQRARRLRFALRNLLQTQSVRVPHTHEAVDWLYRHGGRLAFTASANIVFLGVLVAGLVTFILAVAGHRFELTSHSLAISTLSLFAAHLLAILVHEAGHALAIRHANRRVLAFGFQLYLGHPAFFIDSADILMAPPRDRIRNAWAGPYSGFIIAGACSLVAFLAPSLGAAPFLYQFAALTYIVVGLNLTPFLELDGYWIVTDLIQTVDLRPRSLSFMRYELPQRIRERRGLSRYESALVAFGTFGAIFSALALYTAYLFWAPLFRRLATAMWREGPATRMLLVIFAIMVLGPLLQLAIRAARVVADKTRSALQRLRFLSELRWRREAGELIAELPLLQEIPDEDLDELAGRVRLQWYGAGRVIVRRGDRGDAFYIVRKGRVAVLDETPDGGEQTLRPLGRGEAFGELALLDARPRAATVRADEDSELFVVDKGSFDRVLAGSLKAPEILPSITAVRDVWELPPFRHLDGAAAARIALAGAWRTLPAGTVVIRQGQPGDAFYVVASGQLRVERNRKEVHRLQAGDSFGEIALLDNVARTATVRAITPVRLYALERDAFRRLVAKSFDRQRDGRRRPGPARRARRVRVRG